MMSFLQHKLWASIPEIHANKIREMVLRQIGETPSSSFKDIEHIFKSVYEEYVEDLVQRISF